VLVGGYPRDFFESRDLFKGKCPYVIPRVSPLIMTRPVESKILKIKLILITVLS